MGTPYSQIFHAFLSRVTDDFYGALEEEELEEELTRVLEAALPRFLYIKTDVSDRDNEELEFAEELTNEEIQIFAILMNLVWAEQKLSDIEVVRQLYQDHDFKLTSQASHLRSLLALKSDLELQARRVMHNYSKVEDRKPNFMQLAGDHGEN